MQGLSLVDGPFTFVEKSPILFAYIKKSCTFAPEFVKHSAYETYLEWFFSRQDLQRL